MTLYKDEVTLSDREMKKNVGSQVGSKAWTGRQVGTFAGLQQAARYAQQSFW